MSTAFNPRTVLALVLFGALTFIALLWFIGRGDTGAGEDRSGAHAQGRGLAGYAALADQLRAQGHEVSLSRSPAQIDEESLMILTPTAWADPDDIARIIERRRYAGSTLLILPKWSAAEVPDSWSESRPGWVQLMGAQPPGWADELEGELKIAVELTSLDPRGAEHWQGLGQSGRLPDARSVLGLKQGAFIGLVSDAQDRHLVAYADDGGCYPVLDAAAGGIAAADDCDADRWSLIVAFEPDLFNNYGLADRQRALLAAKVIELAREGQDIPIVFDLTLNGFGASRNLLTLAFEPPFVAATICLLLALAVVAWRAFGRFGPPLAEGRTIAFGKAQLAANGARLIRRSGRLHLLGAPYTALMARRLTRALGLRNADPGVIDQALARRDPNGPSFSSLARDLESARGPGQTLRAAHALKSLERTLVP